MNQSQSGCTGKQQWVDRLRFAAWAARFVSGGRVFGRNGPAPPGKSEVHLFCNGKGVINLNAEIPDGALNLGVAEQ